MSQIDWSKAPEWAVAHALYAFGGEISEVWVGDEQYQRLDHPKSFPYGGGAASSFHNPRRHQFRYETPRPTTWAGQGLPPVGTMCEWKNPVGKWFKAEVRYISRWTLLLQFEKNPFRDDSEDLESAFDPEGVELRPIRTAEQIAADERLYEVRNALTTIKASRSFPGDVARQNVLTATVEAMIDAGYRKQEPTQ